MQPFLVRSKVDRLRVSQLCRLWRSLWNADLAEVADLFLATTLGLKSTLQVDDNLVQLCIFGLLGRSVKFEDLGRRDIGFEQGLLSTRLSQAQLPLALLSLSLS